MSKLKLQISLLFIVFLVSLTGAQTQSFDHLYIDMRGDSDDELEVTFGQIFYDDEGKPERAPFNDNNLLHFIEKMDSSLQLMPLDRDDILIYIHGMWGHMERYFEYNTREMYKGIYSKPENPHGLVISLIWETGIKYGSNVETARFKGRIFGEYLNRIFDKIQFDELKEEGHRLNILCHSMGNRVFEEISKTWEDKAFSNNLIDHLMLMAADLESDIFLEGQSFERLNVMAKEVVVYTHNNDRSLKMSKMINNNDRLGLDGITKLEVIPNYVRVVDVSLLNDDEDPASRFSNHRYFFTSETVRQDLLNEFNCENYVDIPNRKPLVDDRIFKLLFEEKK